MIVPAHRLTGSRVELALKCPPSMILPWEPDAPGPGAHRGSAGHDFLERVGTGTDRDKALSLVPEEWRPFCEGLDLDSIPHGAEWAHEVAIAFDVSTGKGRELCRGQGRPDYGQHDLRPYEIAMTLDLVGVAGDRAYVKDYKTGHSDISPPKSNGQLWSGAVAVAATYPGIATVEVELVRIREDGSPWRPRPYVLDAFDLDLFHIQLRDLFVEIVHVQRIAAEGSSVPVKPGPHCSGLYCPAFTNCPAQFRLIRQAAKEFGIEDFDAEQMLEGMEPEDVAKVYLKERMISAALKKVRGAVRSYATRRPIPVPGGKVYGQREVVRDELDGSAVYRVLAEEFDHETAAGAVKMEGTKKAIEDVARAKRPKGVTIKAEKERLFDLVDKAGGLRKKTQRRVEEFRAPKEIGDGAPRE